MKINKVTCYNLCICGNEKIHEKSCLVNTINSKKEKKVPQNHLSNNLVKKWSRKNKVVILSSQMTHQLKMSEVILDFARELLDFATSLQERKAALMLAITGWNLTFFSATEQEQKINDVVSTLSGEKFYDWKTINTILQYFMRKKQLEYPDLNRMILDFEIAKKKDDDHLNVIWKTV